MCARSTNARPGAARIAQHECAAGRTHPSGDGGEDGGLRAEVVGEDGTGGEEEHADDARREELAQGDGADGGREGDGGVGDDGAADGRDEDGLAPRGVGEAAGSLGGLGASHGGRVGRPAMSKEKSALELKADAKELKLQEAIQAKEKANDEKGRQILQLLYANKKLLAYVMQRRLSP